MHDQGILKAEPPGTLKTRKKAAIVGPLRSVKKCRPELCIGGWHHARFLDKFSTIENHTRQDFDSPMFYSLTKTTGSEQN